MKPSKQGTLKTQLLRHKHVEVVHTDLVEEIDVGYVEEGLGPNVDVEVVEEDRKDDPEQVMLMTTARTMKLAKSMSRVVARCCHQEGKGLVEEDCVEEIDRKMVMMCRCGGGGVVVADGKQRGPGVDQGSATMSNCSRIWSEGCSKLGISEVVGLLCRRVVSMHGR